MYCIVTRGKVTTKDRDYEVCSSRRLGETRLLGQEAFQKMIKCRINEADVNNDKTSTVITPLE